MPRDLARRDREHLGAVLARGDAQKLPHRVRIGKRPVARTAVDAVARDQAVEGVARMPGIEPPRQAHGAQRLCQELEACAFELVAQETVVEARVVGDESAPGKPLVESGGELGEARRTRRHLVGDAGERLDRRRDRGPWIHQGRPLRAHLEAVDLDDADLGDAVPRRLAAGRFEVDHCERAFQVVYHVADSLHVYSVTAYYALR